MPKDPHKNGGVRHDWLAIKTEYVTNPDTSLRKLAEKYGVCYRTIAVRSKAEGWVAARKASISRIASKTISRAEDKMARQLSKEADFLDLMKGHMEGMLKDSDQFRRHLIETKVVDDDGTMIISPEERIYDKYDSRAMKDAMQVLQMMESMTRSLYNIQKGEQLERRQIERERLEIEKERLALEKERQALKNDSERVSDELYGVVLIPEVTEDGE